MNGATMRQRLMMMMMMSTLPLLLLLLLRLLLMMPNLLTAPPLTLAHILTYNFWFCLNLILFRFSSSPFLVWMKISKGVGSVSFALPNCITHFNTLSNCNGIVNTLPTFSHWKFYTSTQTDYVTLSSLPVLLCCIIPYNSLPLFHPSTPN